MKRNVKKRKKRKARRKTTPRAIKPRMQKKAPATRYFHYKITYDPINVYRIPSAIEDEVEEMYHLARSKPQEAIDGLERLIDRYPSIPQLYNYLCVAYSACRKNRQAEEIIKLSCQKFPDYLFAKLNYAEMCISKGEIDKIPEIFNNTFELSLLYPKRDTFHISEVTGFYSLMGRYCHLIGNIKQAMIYLENLKKLDPKNPVTKRLERQLFIPLIKRKVLARLNQK